MRGEERLLLVGEGLDRVVHRAAGPSLSSRRGRRPQASRCSSTRSSRAFFSSTGTALSRRMLDAARPSISERGELVVEPGAVADDGASRCPRVANARRGRRARGPRARSGATSRCRITGARSCRAGCGTASRRPARPPTSSPSRADSPPRTGRRGARRPESVTIEAGGSPRSPAPTARNSSVSRAKESLEGRPVLQVDRLAEALRALRRHRSPGSVQPPPRSRPRRSASRGRAATAATWRSGGGRSRRWRAPRPTSTRPRRAWSAGPPRAHARRASRSRSGECRRGRGSSSSACRRSRGRRGRRTPPAGRSASSASLDALQERSSLCASGGRLPRCW